MVLVTDFYGGGELRELASNGISESQAAKLLLQIAAGVSYMHSRGVVHGDLKVLIVVLGEKNNCVLIFYLAHILILLILS